MSTIPDRLETAGLVNHQGKSIVLAYSADKEDEGKTDLYYSVLNLKVESARDENDWSSFKKLLFAGDVPESEEDEWEEQDLPQKELRITGMELLTIPFDLGVISPERQPFQMLSYGKHVYLFRQSSKQSLLVNRFVMTEMRNADASDSQAESSGNSDYILQPVWEVRFQRSGLKDVPASESDSQNFVAKDGTPFFEPTLELTVVKVAGGKFSVVITPSHEGGAHWQIFTVDSENKLQRYCIPCSEEDGLFDFTNYSSEEQPQELQLQYNDVPLVPIAGPATILYGQQEAAIKLDAEQSDKSNKETIENDPKLKRGQRLMLAVPVTIGSSNSESNTSDSSHVMAIVDYGINGKGELVPFDGNTSLPVIDGTLINNNFTPAPNNQELFSAELNAYSIPQTFYGLASYGSLLGQVKTASAPSLLEGADGLVHLYFTADVDENGNKQSDGQLRAAQFDTQVQRATIEADWQTIEQVDIEQETGKLLLVSNLPGPVMSGTEITLSPHTDIDSLCTMLVNYPLAAENAGIQDELWTGLPRDAALLSAILSGYASDEIENSSVRDGTLPFFDYQGTKKMAWLPLNDNEQDVGGLWLITRREDVPLKSVKVAEDSATSQYQLSLTFDANGIDYLQVWNNIPLGYKELLPRLNGTGSEDPDPTVALYEPGVNSGSLYGLNIETVTGASGSLLLFTQASLFNNAIISITDASNTPANQCKLTITDKAENLIFEADNLSREQTLFIESLKGQSEYSSFIIHCSPDQLDGRVQNQNIDGAMDLRQASALFSVIHQAHGETGQIQEDEFFAAKGLQSRKLNNVIAGDKIPKSLLGFFVGGSFATRSGLIPQVQMTPANAGVAQPIGTKQKGSNGAWRRPAMSQALQLKGGNGITIDTSSDGDNGNTNVNGIPSVLMPEREFTLEAWIKPQSSQPAAVIAGSFADETVKPGNVQPQFLLGTQQQKTLCFSPYVKTIGDTAGVFLQTHGSPGSMLEDNFTLEAWVKPDVKSIGDNQSVLKEANEILASILQVHYTKAGDNRNAKVAHLALDEDRHVVIGVNTGKSGQDEEAFIRSMHRLRAEEWQHIAVVYSRSFIKIYIDGELQILDQFVTVYQHGKYIGCYQAEERNDEYGEEAPSFYSLNNSNYELGVTRNLLFGSPLCAVGAGSNDLRNVTLFGNIAQIRIWDRDQSTAEININRYMVMNGSEPELKACWPLVDFSEMDSQNPKQPAYGASTENKVIRNYDTALYLNVHKAERNTPKHLLEIRNVLKINNGNAVCYKTKADKVFKLEGSFTIELWLKPGNVNNVDSCILQAIETNMPRRPWILRLNNERQIVFSYLKDARTLGSVTVAAPIDLEQWGHIAVVYDNASSVIRIYINGEKQRLFLDKQEATGSDHEQKITRINTAHVHIPTLYLGNNTSDRITPHYPSLQSSLTELRIWQSARTVDQIKGFMAVSLDDSSVSDGDKQGQLGYWPLTSSEDKSTSLFHSHPSHDSYTLTYSGDADKVGIVASEWQSTNSSDDFQPVTLVQDDYLLSLFAQIGNTSPVVGSAFIRSGAWNHIAATYRAGTAVILNTDRKTWQSDERNEIKDYDFLKCGVNEWFNAGNKLSLEAWVNLAAESPRMEQTILAKWGTEAENQSFRLGIDHANRLYFLVRLGDQNNTLLELKTIESLDPQVDYHVAASFSGETETTVNSPSSNALSQGNDVSVTMSSHFNLRLYLNGQRLSTEKLTTSGPEKLDEAYVRINASETELCIGRSAYVNNKARITLQQCAFFHGLIAEPRIWGRQLSEKEVSYIFDTVRVPVNTNDLLGYWRFDEGAGKTAHDSGISNSNAALSGNDLWALFERNSQLQLYANGNRLLSDSVKGGGPELVVVAKATLSKGSELSIENSSNGEINTCNAILKNAEDGDSFILAENVSRSLFDFALEPKLTQYFEVPNPSHNGYLVNGKAKLEPNKKYLLSYSEVSPDITVRDTGLFLGTVQKNGILHNGMKGFLDEVRIWRSARTLQQLGDNQYRKMHGSEEDLVGYWNFNKGGAELNDLSGNRNHCRSIGSPAVEFNHASAPVGNEAPIVNNVYAHLEAQESERFDIPVRGRPMAVEYSDMQYDDAGELTAVMKRCYAYVSDDLALFTGYKVGDLLLTYLGQVQSRPNIIGFIEGAPPVPSENLSRPLWTMLDSDEWNRYEDGADAVTVSGSESVSLSYTLNKEESNTHELAVQVGANIEGELVKYHGGGEFRKTIYGIELELAAKFEGSLAYKNSREESVGVNWSRSTSDSVRLRGQWEGYQEDKQNYLNPQVGRRFEVNNVGYALVESMTADLYAMRQRDSGALVAITIVPNKDIGKDKNIITFPINSEYQKAGTLDGKIGLVNDPAYSDADVRRRSYFKPLEAYQLKRRIERENARLEKDYAQFRTIGRDITKVTAADVNIGGSLPENPRSRSMYGSYIWSATGGLHKENAAVATSQEKTFGGLYNFAWGLGGYVDIKHSLAPSDASSMGSLSPSEFESGLFKGAQISRNLLKHGASAASNGGIFNAIGIHIAADYMYSHSLTVQLDKTRADEKDFSLEVDLRADGVMPAWDQDEQEYTPQACPGKVDGYRFMSYYLAPSQRSGQVLFDEIIEPKWLQLSNDPNAIALRNLSTVYRDGGNPVWRLLHRVTYVSRIPPRFNYEPDERIAPKERLPENLDGNVRLLSELNKLMGSQPTATKIGTEVAALIKPDDTSKGLNKHISWWQDFLNLAQAPIVEDGEVTEEQRKARESLDQLMMTLMSYAKPGYSTGAVSDYLRKIPELNQ